MYEVVKIGDKEIPMLAMASIDIYYKRVFHEDPLTIMMDPKTDNGAKTGVAFRMGFIMAKFAELKDRKQMMQLTEDAYIDWLEQFDYGDYLAATGEVIEIYYAQKNGTSKEKKEARP